MFDIDKELEGLKNERISPSEQLRQDTRRKIKQNVSGKQNKAFAFKPALKICTAAVLAIVMLVTLSVNFTAPAHAEGYYTIDINPSLSLAVNVNNIVLYAKAENDDAKSLLNGIELKGLSAEDALKLILQKAVKDSYLKDNGCVLVAHFGEGEGITQQEAGSIVTKESLGNVKVLVINGEISDYEKAVKAGKKAGIELLFKNAKDLGIDDTDISGIIKKVSEKENNKNSPVNSSKSDNTNNGSGYGITNSDNNGNGNGNNDTVKDNSGNDNKDTDKDSKDNDNKNSDKGKSGNKTKSGDKDKSTDKDSKDKDKSKKDK